MQRRHAGFPADAHPTVERRVRVWQPLYGPEREVIFRQEHPPGRQGLPDFADAGELGVRILVSRSTGAEGNRQLLAALLVGDAIWCASRVWSSGACWR